MSEEGSASCDKCVVSYHIGQSTTARPGTVSSNRCLAPLWNFVLLEAVVYTILGSAVLYGLKLHRDMQTAEANAESASSPASTSDLEAESEGADDQKERRRKTTLLYVANGESENAETDDSLPIPEEEDTLTDVSAPASASNYFSDLLLQYPVLVSIKVFLGRMAMVLDMGSDLVLILSLFANDAGGSFCIF